jgi:predicted HAD superfamily Cof-like phosphohydrolase
MEKQIMQVKEFQDAVDAPSPSRPTLLPIKRAKLRQDLLQEEVNEIRKGSYEGDIVQIADGVIDCMYILIGTAHEHGFADRLDMLFDEVHRSNMSKMGPDGKAIYREDGKVMKSERYSPPNLERIMSRNFDLYRENKVLKEIAEMQNKETEDLIKLTIKKKLRILDRIRYFIWEKLSKNLSKKIEIEFPQNHLAQISVKIYGVSHPIE